MRHLLFAVSVFALSLAASGVEALSIIDDVRVDALVGSHWGQLYAGGNEGGGEPCYNYHTPHLCYCGCGATALAQIMRYHRWPQTAVDTNYFAYGFDGLNKMVRSVPSYSCKYAGAALDLTMKGGVYDWSLMPLETLKIGTPEPSREMIGRLCYDIGVSMSSSYDKKDGTGSSTAVAVLSLPGNFHYADAAAIEFSIAPNMPVCTRDILERAVLANLEAGLPCGLQIAGPSGSHIVVCDGYGYHKNDGKLYLHLNVGYSGSWDGWYAYGDAWSLNGHDFTQVKGILYNISPTVNGPIISGHVVDGANRPIVGASVRVTRNGQPVTNVVSNARGRYLFKTEPGSYEVSVSTGKLSRTTYMKLEPCISTAYIQTGDYVSPPVDVRLANRFDEDLVLDAVRGQVARPIVLPADGTTFTSSQRVELYCETEGAEIYYTLDGSYPTTAATRYLEPFEVTRAITVRAIAVKAGLYSSEITTCAYIESTYGDLLNASTTPWESGGYAIWYKDTVGRDTWQLSGTDTKDRLRSGLLYGATKSGVSSWLEATVEGPATMSFQYRFWPSGYCAFVVTTDGSTTNRYEKADSYADEALVEWQNLSVVVTTGVHKVRLSYETGRNGGGNYGEYGVHLRNTSVKYPYVLTATLPGYYNESWHYLSMKNGEGKDGLWCTLTPTNARVTITGASTLRTLTINEDADMRSLTLKGRMRIDAENGHKLTIESVRVLGQVELQPEALAVSGQVALADRDATVTVPIGSSLVPVSGVSGTRAVRTEVSGSWRYSLAVSYASPFSAVVPKTAATWSALRFVDRNGNEGAWADLLADSAAQVTLNTQGDTVLTIDAPVSIRALMAAGTGVLTLTKSGANEVSLGDVTLPAGRTLRASASLLTSLSGGGTFETSDDTWPVGKGLVDPGWYGTLRLTGTALPDGGDFGALGNTGSSIVFAGALASGAALKSGQICTSALTLESTLRVANGAAAEACVFSGSLSGSGSFIATSDDGSASGTAVYRLTGSMKDFAGSLEIGGHHALVIGEANVTAVGNRGKILVPSGIAAAIPAGCTWFAANGLEVAGELTVASGAGVTGGIVLAAVDARVTVCAGAAVIPTCGVEHYETETTAVGDNTLYTLKIAKVTHAGPYVATPTSASVNWTDLVWSDANGLPGAWSDLESDGTDAFTIAADHDVTITMSGVEAAASIRVTGSGRVTLLYPNALAVPAGITNAFRNALWTGTVKLAGSRVFSNVDFSAYGNAGSTIELAGSPSGSLKPNGRCEAALVLAPYCVFTVKGGTARSVYTFAGPLSGSGEIYYNSYAASQAVCYAGDTTAFAGCVNAVYGCVTAVGAYSYSVSDKNNMIVNAPFTFRSGTVSVITGAVIVNNELTIESGVTLKIDYTKRTPVRLSSPAARVFVAKGCSIGMVSAAIEGKLVEEKSDAGTLYYFDNTKPGLMFWVE